jgi:hypothetical protein
MQAAVRTSAELKNGRQLLAKTASYKSTMVLSRKWLTVSGATRTVLAGRQIRS